MLNKKNIIIFIHAIIPTNAIYFIMSLAMFSISSRKYNIAINVRCEGTETHKGDTKNIKVWGEKTEREKHGDDECDMGGHFDCLTMRICENDCLLCEPI